MKARLWGPTVLSAGFLALTVWAGSPPSTSAAQAADGELRGRISVEGSGTSAESEEPDVVVYLAGEALDGEPPPPAGETRMMDQVDYAFAPRLLAVMAGEEMAFQNSDSIAHNVHTSSMGRRRNRDFNRNQRPGQMLLTTFPVPDSLRVVCDVHTQMLAHIFVVPNRFFTLARVNGEYRITGIPAGRHELSAWHEDFGFLTQEVEIRAGEATVVDLQFRW
jgi:plastocyanin